MKSKTQIKAILKWLDENKGELVWETIGFTPYSYTDVENTLKWVLDVVE